MLKACSESGHSLPAMAESSGFLGFRKLNTLIVSSINRAGGESSYSLICRIETMIKSPVYLDYNATTPCDPRVLETMLPYFSTNFGNAASKTHAYGWVAEEAVAIGREQVAKLIGADTTEIIFTSGATEAINLALQGVFETDFIDVI